MTTPDPTPERPKYARYFDCEESLPPASAPAAPVFSHATALDNRLPYLATDEIERAVNVALAVGRPLLVKGEPGCGKTALARHIARYFDWGFESYAVKSETTVQDLEWRIDTVRRLNDAYGAALIKRLDEPASSATRSDLASTAKVHTLEPYVERGPLWRAFTGESQRLPAQEGGLPPKGRPTRVVLLIDEIDKADPDVPNGLLDALGNMQFRGPEPDQTIEAAVLPFVMLTSNDERELPAAFLRRCVLLEINVDFNGERLFEIAAAHYPKADRELVEAIRDKLLEYRGQAGSSLRKPSIAEFLDAVHACLQLDVGPDHDLWEAILRLALWKHPSAATL